MKEANVFFFYRLMHVVQSCAIKSKDIGPSDLGLILDDGSFAAFAQAPVEVLFSAKATLLCLLVPLS